MTALSSIPYLLVFLLCEISYGFMAENVEGNLSPSIFKMDDQISLLRQRRAASDPLLYYESDIEISFPDPSLEMEIKGFMQNLSLYPPLLGNFTTLTSIDFAPACHLTGSTAACTCKKNYECLGTLGSCNETDCVCVTTLPLQKYCKPKSNITMFPEGLFQGDTVTIGCNFIELTNVSWYHDSENISDNAKYSTTYSRLGTMVLYTLKITNVTDSDKGIYNCTMTVNTTSQNLSIAIKNIKVLQINQSSNLDTFCDGSTLNMACCSDDIDAFNVTWTPTGQGTESSNATCKIYTITSSVTPCPPDQTVTKYTCSFQRNGSAPISKIINVTYLQKATIEILPVSPVSAGKALDITCQTDVTIDRIDWAKDITSNIVFSSNYTRSSIFKIRNTTVKWSGIFICIAYQKSLHHSTNVTVKVVPLPRNESIQVFPLQTYLLCGTMRTLTCCVLDFGYSVFFSNGTSDILGKNPTKVQDLTCYTYEQSVECSTGTTSSVNCVVSNDLRENAMSTKMLISYLDANPPQKNCPEQNGCLITPSGKTYSVPCQSSNALFLGNIIYTCSAGTWSDGINECYSAEIFMALQNVKDLVNSPQLEQNLPGFLENLTTIAKEEKERISTLSQNIEYMVQILSVVANTNVPVHQQMMMNFIQTVDIVVNKSSAWTTVPNQSCELLRSVENFAKRLQFNNSDYIEENSTTNIQLIGRMLHTNTSFDENFSLLNLNGSVVINKGSLPGDSNTVVTIAYATMKDILPQNTTKVINGLVMSTVINNPTSKDINKDIFNITMSFSNSSLEKPVCAWFDLDLKVWNDSGCSTSANNSLVTCTCNHLTSFSVFMAEISDPILDIITYVGVGTSLVCLVITLAIEAIVWRSVIKNKTSYLRHVCLVNIAVTLLIADIWFIIGGTLKTPKSDVCQTDAFFSFFFYLSFFFWMLTNGLILFYRLVYLLHDMSRTNMMIIAFIVGYGCPLLITVVTVASTAPSKRFTHDKYCWLNYKESKSFLAFLVPALTIVFINLVILVVVIFKLLRPAIGERPGQEERKALVVIAKTIAVLTPLLGTTWGFGIAVVGNPLNKTLHGIFVFLNSFQGLFILISTVLLDQKVRQAVRSSISLSYWSTLRTKVATTSTNSSAPLKLFKKKSFFGKKGAYNLFTANSSSNGASADSYSVVS